MFDHLMASVSVGPVAQTYPSNIEAGGYGATRSDSRTLGLKAENGVPLSDPAFLLNPPIGQQALEKQHEVRHSKFPFCVPLSYQCSTTILGVKGR